jgi:hypothetical protein
MTEPPKAPAEKSEPSAFEKMKEFTRRLVAVPKSELPKPRENKKRKP